MSPYAKCPRCALTFETDDYGRVVDHSCHGVVEWENAFSRFLPAHGPGRSRRSTVSPPAMVGSDPAEALARVRTAIAGEMSRTRVQADALDEIERLVSNLELACVRHVAEAREAGRKAGFAAGLDHAASLAEHTPIRCPGCAGLAAMLRQLATKKE